MKRFLVFLTAAVFLYPPFVAMALALDVNDKLSIEGNLAGAYQYQSLSDAPDYDDVGRGAVVFRPAIRFQLTEKDVVYAKFAFAAGNALNDGTAPFALSPWSATLEDDVKNIGGRNRDYLLTAWYAHAFSLGTAGTLEMGGGIIDAAKFLDTNVYANCEYAQFLNAALVNGPNTFLPSFEPGGAAQWDIGNWSIKAVYMSVAENDDGESFSFGGAEIDYTLQLGMGEGNYRLNLNGTTDDFSSPDGTPGQSRYSVMISCDQQMGEILGAWVRLGWQDDDALIDYQKLFSGGINVIGALWARQQDNIGIGYAYLDGGNSDIDYSSVLELYYRWVFNEVAALTLDFQYLIDNYNTGDDPKGLISGLRFVASF